MTDKDKTELLEGVLKALFGTTLTEGSYMVEVKLNTIVDAKDVKEAEQLGLEYAKAHMGELKPWAVKIKGILEED